ncbi:hypothetical protein N7534_005035 [Penicillium rubens]|nr:hypothetical protein N7534_005035 [Penicillium rubens]
MGGVIVSNNLQIVQGSLRVSLSMAWKATAVDDKDFSEALDSGCFLPLELYESDGYKSAFRVDAKRTDSDWRTSKDFRFREALASTAAAFQAMDNDTRKRSLNDLQVIANYDGVILNDAARKWTPDCDRYISELSKLTGHDSPDEAKILYASGKLVKVALQRLEQRERQHIVSALNWDIPDPMLIQRFVAFLQLGQPGCKARLSRSGHIVG